MLGADAFFSSAADPRVRLSPAGRLVRGGFSDGTVLSYD
ncbi:hypothetical protein A33M_0235 [Rhodovulum sp. PH10]|nr:hypothetical protein A33M_0235 [Rhodovulum sp. PH10]